MTDGTPFRAGSIHAFDQERHELRERLADPVTMRHLKSIGIGKRWKCLDVAAGSGSVAVWLAGQVGSQGVVVATDIDTRFLSKLSVPNIEVRQHDITQHAFEPGGYDLVHCRALLMHLDAPERALDRMVAALKPGGWLLVEDADFGSVGAADLRHPAAEHFNRLIRVMTEAWRAARILDPYFGRRVRGLAETSGLINIRHEGTTWISRGGEDGARFLNMTTQILPAALYAAGFTEAHIQDLSRLFEDPSFSFADVTLFSAWGQRPA